MARRSLKGRLLVASSQLGDPNFFRSVVYMLEHGERGALGLVLNRPTSIELTHADTRWSDIATPPALAYTGGPVEPDAAIGLVRVREGASPPEWTASSGRIGTIDLNAEPETLRDDLEAFRLFFGYSGWGSEQLDSEINSGAWVVVDAAAHDILTPNPANLWHQVMQDRQQRPDRPRTLPPDPSLN